MLDSVGVVNKTGTNSPEVGRFSSVSVERRAGTSLDGDGVRADRSDV